MSSVIEQAAANALARVIMHPQRTRLLEEPHEAFTVADTATILGVSKHSIYRRINEGSLPTIELGGRKLIARATIERLIAG